MTVMVVISLRRGYDTAIHAALIEPTPTTLKQNIQPNTRLMNTSDADCAEKDDDLRASVVIRAPS